MKATIALKLTNEAGQIITVAADVPSWLLELLGGVTVNVEVPDQVPALPEVVSHVQVSNETIAVELKDVASKAKKQSKKAKEAAQAIEAPAPAIEAPAPAIEAAVEGPCPECGTDLPADVIEEPAPVVMTDIDQTKIRECIWAALRKTSPATVISCLESVAGVKRVSEVDPSMFEKVYKAISAL